MKKIIQWFLNLIEERKRKNEKEKNDLKRK